MSPYESESMSPSQGREEKGGGSARDKDDILILSGRYLVNYFYKSFDDIKFNYRKTKFCLNH